MEDKNIKFGQLHAIVEIIALLTAIEYYIKEPSISLLVGIGILTISAVFDVIIAKLMNDDKIKGEKLMIGLRIIGFLIISAFIVYNNSGIKEIEVISFLILFLRMTEMVFLFDYSDKYTRVIVVGVMVFPITVFVLIKLLLLDRSTDYGDNAAMALGSLAEITTVVVAVIFVSNIFVKWISSIEYKIMEQRRMAEKTAEINDDLKLHQDKLKKANEELGIQRLRMENVNRQIRAANAEIKTQNEVLKNVTSCLDLVSLADRIPEVICDSMDDILFCSVLLAPASKKGNPVFNAKAKDISGEFLKTFTSNIMNRGLNSGDTGDIIIDKDLTAECYSALTEEDKLSVVAKIPLFTESGEAGVIYCGSRNSEAFDENINLLQNISTEILLGINNIMLYYKLQQLAVMDGLTGIYNRRTLNEKLADYGQTAEREHTALSVALFDIDHFKGFNDTYGHACGDVVLQKIAGIIDGIADENSGLAARYGGEEFVLVFPSCDKERCLEILKETKQAIDDLRIEYDGKQLSVSVSIGYSTYPEIRKSTNELLGRADSAMYFVKEHGRNNIKCDGPDVEEFESSRK